MRFAEQIPRGALVWLIALQLLLLLPHWSHIPPWSIAVPLLAAGWRWLVYSGKASLPGRPVRALMVILTSAGVYWHYGSLLGLEPMVALLLSAFALKLSETQGVRDGFILIFLGFFIELTALLFSQELPMVLFAVLLTVALLAALQALNQSTVGGSSPLRDFTSALTMLLQALPMMLVLFLVFPRIDPLWSIPSRNGSGTTGMSDTLRPGQVSKLSRSSELAFRVQFEGEAPPRKEWYWRGMTMSEFEDGGWRSLKWFSVPAAERAVKAERIGDAQYRYRVIMEPTLQHWLYAMPYAMSEDPGILEAPDFRLVTPQRVETQRGYNVTSFTDVLLDPTLSDWRFQVETAFPKNENPDTREWLRARGLFNVGPEAAIEDLLTFFRSEPFYYTLEPPPLAAENFVDQFLFDSRRGFCEHYAYTFVAIMRMLGHPARIVGGYQGGELNPYSNTVTVRQLDAHAWAEVWLAGRGWIRVDPTAAVSPARIELGLTDALAEDPGFLADSPLSALKFRNIDFLNNLRLYYDAAAWRWYAFVVGFNSERQLGFLKNLFGEINVSWFAASLIGSWALGMGLISWWLLRTKRTKTRTDAEQAFVDLCKKLEERGLIRERGESPVSFLRRAAEYFPEQETEMKKHQAYFEQSLYRD